MITTMTKEKHSVGGLVVGDVTFVVVVIHIFHAHHFTYHLQ
jgi:hypothetical protein